MNNPQPPPPPGRPGSGPERRPYGMVGLAAPVRAVRSARRSSPAADGRWYGPRPELPPLSIDALRGPGAPP
ncbi:hypothetical protein ACFU99_06960 [Streptomyces sp. NPDC057654]|uniref:hypothetical protein n=1 Tax=Streptomyces sp. NPDC057654 TaxID=3346196 RepID=UPI00367593F6